MSPFVFYMLILLIKNKKLVFILSIVLVIIGDFFHSVGIHPVFNVCVELHLLPEMIRSESGVSFSQINKYFFFSPDFWELE